MNTSKTNIFKLHPCGTKSSPLLLTKIVAPTLPKVPIENIDDLIALPNNKIEFIPAVAPRNIGNN